MGCWTLAGAANGGRGLIARGLSGRCVCSDPSRDGPRGDGLVGDHASFVDRGIGQTYFWRAILATALAQFFDRGDRGCTGLGRWVGCLHRSVSIERGRAVVVLGLLGRDFFCYSVAKENGSGDGTGRGAIFSIFWCFFCVFAGLPFQDRKSTRLNSS